MHCSRSKWPEKSSRSSRSFRSSRAPSPALRRSALPGLERPREPGWSTSACGAARSRPAAEPGSMRPNESASIQTPEPISCWEAITRLSPIDVALLGPGSPVITKAGWYVQRAASSGALLLLLLLLGSSKSGCRPASQQHQAPEDTHRPPPGGRRGRRRREKRRGKFYLSSRAVPATIQASLSAELTHAAAGDPPLHLHQPRSHSSKHGRPKHVHRQAKNEG